MENTSKRKLYAISSDGVFKLLSSLHPEVYFVGIRNVADQLDLIVETELFMSSDLLKYGKNFIAIEFENRMEADNYYNTINEMNIQSCIAHNDTIIHSNLDYDEYDFA